MFDFIFNCKQTIIKYKKQLLTLALIPVFMFWSSLSGFAAEIVGIDNGSVVRFNKEPELLIFNGSSQVYSGQGVFNDYRIGSTMPSNYSFNNPLISNASLIYFGHPSFNNNVIINSSLFDYYFIFIIHNNVINQNKSDFSFVPTSLRLESYADNSYVFLNDLTFSAFGDSETVGVSIVGKLPDNVNFSQFSYFNIIGSGGFPSGIFVSPFVYVTDKGNDNVMDSIVAAINNQTNLIMNAGSGFGGTSSGILSGNDQLSGFIDDYTEIEQSMYDKFTENQSAVIGNFSGFSWGSLSTAVDWTSDYLNRIYDNSGDFRTMFMYPILAGIALIFIGRQGLTAYVRSRRDK